MKASAALSRLKLHESFGCSIQKSMVRMNEFERFVVFYGDEREPKPKIIEKLLKTKNSARNNLNRCLLVYGTRTLSDGQKCSDRLSVGSITAPTTTPRPCRNFPGNILWTSLFSL